MPPPRVACPSNATDPEQTSHHWARAARFRAPIPSRTRIRSKLAILISLSIIAGYWLLVLALGLVGIRHLCLRSSHSRRIGALFLVGSCGLVVASIYAPEINAWLFFRNVSPPRALVILSKSLDVDQIAANFATTGSFDVFVTSPSFTVTYGVSLHPVVIEQTMECEAGGSQAALPNAIPRACIRRRDAIASPSCRLQITFEGSPPSTEQLAETAWIYIMKTESGEVEEPCPFYRSLFSPDWGPNFIPLVPLVGRFLDYLERRFDVFSRPKVPHGSAALLAEVSLPTRDSILHTLRNVPSRLECRFCAQQKMIPLW
jgi:hypothetical protein